MIHIFIKYAEYNDDRCFVGNAGCVERIQVYVDDNGVGNLWHYEAQDPASAGILKSWSSHTIVQVYIVHICIFAGFQDCLQR